MKPEGLFISTSSGELDRQVDAFSAALATLRPIIAEATGPTLVDRTKGSKLQCHRTHYVVPAARAGTSADVQLTYAFTRREQQLIAVLTAEGVGTQGIRIDEPLRTDHTNRLDPGAKPEELVRLIDLWLDLAASTRLEGRRAAGPNVKGKTPPELAALTAQAWPDIAAMIAGYLPEIAADASLFYRLSYPSPYGQAQAGVINLKRSDVPNDLLGQAGREAVTRLLPKAVSLTNSCTNTGAIHYGLRPLVDIMLRIDPNASVVDIMQSMMRFTDISPRDFFAPGLRPQDIAA